MAPWEDMISHRRELNLDLVLDEYMTVGGSKMPGEYVVKIEINSPLSSGRGGCSLIEKR